jgi:hypothetical protein
LQQGNISSLVLEFTPGVCLSAFLPGVIPVQAGILTIYKQHYSPAHETGDFASVISLVHSFCFRQLCSPLIAVIRFVPGFVEFDQILSGF